MTDGPRYSELAPDRLPAPIRDLVECAWRARTPPVGHRQRVLPDGCMDLILTSGRPLGGAELAELVRTAVGLRRTTDDRRVPEPLPRPALRALGRGMAVAEVADRLGVTARTLHRRCVATLGYGPSTARRVLRFRTASILLFDGVAPAEAAARAGYADQPHLSREVRALSGLSPTALATPPTP